MSEITPATISPFALLLVLGAAGHTISRRGDGLMVSNRRALSPELQEAIQANKHGLLALAGTERAR
jgi:hypothetical protein